MLERFKKLTKLNKIIVVIIALILLPITLLAIGVYMTISGFKNKKYSKIIGGLALTVFMLFTFVLSENTSNDVSESEKELEEVVEVEKEEIEQPTMLNVVIEESIEEKDGKVRFHIKTNLPDTAELMVGIFEINNGDYKGQTHVTIENGEAITEWFSNKGESLNNGDYTLSISMSNPKLQSEEVQKVVGENGEYLDGDLVEKGDDSSYVSMKKTITLEGLSSEKETEQEEVDNQGIYTNSVKQVVNTIIKREIEDNLTNTTMDFLRVNENLGTDLNEDVIVLVDLSWSTKNTEKTTREMLEMYSDHLAASISSELADGSEIALFWDAEYTGLDIKHSYYIKNGNAYKQ